MSNIAGIAGIGKSLTSKSMSLSDTASLSVVRDHDALTLLPTPPEITCETCETCTNQDFMDAIFPSVPEGAHPAIVSFKGNPHSVLKAEWFAKPYAGQNLDPDANCYFGVSSYHNDESGAFRRTKKTFAALHAVMLDDLGTKVPLDRVTLPLSWLIETSEGNHQGGFILAEPIADAGTADRLMNAIIAAGLCDPGAGGPTARLARLPVAINGKTDPAFRCRLTQWRPDLRYPASKLVDGLGLELPQAGAPTRQQKTARDKGSATRSNGADEDVFIPRPDENPVLAVLRERGLYKTPLGSGKHDITCPWLSEHTDAVDSGTAYWEPDEGFPFGGFKCQHSHGDRLHIRELLEELGVMAAAARMKPVIRQQAGRLHAMVDRAEQMLADSGHYYQSAGLVVSVQTDPATNETAITPVSQNSLLRALSRVSDWHRFDGRSEDWVTADPPARVVAVLFDETRYPHLPVLRGISRQPHLREDGTLVCAAGYDPSSGRYGVFDARQFPIPASCSRADAEAALAILCEVVDEVAFASEVDRSAALSAMLTAASRPSLPTAPGYLVCAHTIGSGKSFLTRLLGAFASPQAIPGIAFPRDADEMRKTLIAMLIKSPAVINFDDMSGDIIPSEAMKTALTEEFIGGRLLGVSKDVVCSTRTLFLFSGNNVQPVADMARRVLTIHLDPQCETPAAREFKNPNREADTRRHRGRYVAAALTIIRAWIQAGCPKAAVKPVASYSRWGEWCRHSLIWLGQSDPAGRLFEQLAHDPDAELLGRILEGWHSEYGERAKLVREVIADVDNGVLSVDFREALLDAAGERGEVKGKLLGWWLKKHTGRIVGGLKILKSDDSRGAVRWKAQVSQVSQEDSSAVMKTVSNAEVDV
jgi:hypothetical protein